jgi:hypothetical protein
VPPVSSADSWVKNGARNSVSNSIPIIEIAFITTLPVGLLFPGDMHRSIKPLSRGAMGTTCIKEYIADQGRQYNRETYLVFAHKKINPPQKRKERKAVVCFC